MIALLLDFHADPNKTTATGETALSMATANNHLSAVELLLNAGANPSATSQKQLRAIDVAVLGGHYEVATVIFASLDTEAKLLKTAESYRELSRKFNCRYVNYQIFLNGLVEGKSTEELEDYLQKTKALLEDPVVDPLEDWRSWARRQLQFRSPPLVERASLPENMQPQNRLLGKLNHYTYNFTRIHNSQKTSLVPKFPSDVGSELQSFKTPKETLKEAAIEGN